MESTSVGSIKIIIKMLLNSLLGRLGMNIHKPITEIVDKENLYLIASTRESNWKQITEEDFLVTYYPEISKVICESHDIDYFKASYITILFFQN